MTFPVWFNSMVLSSSEFRLFCSGTVNSTIYEFVRKVFKLFLNPIFDPVLNLFEFVTVIHMKTLRSSGIECQWDEVTYELPSIIQLLDAEKMIHCMKESCTIQHFPKKRTWVCSSWGKFLITCKNCSEPTYFYQFIQVTGVPMQLNVWFKKQVVNIYEWKITIWTKRKSTFPRENYGANLNRTKINIKNPYLIF